MHKVETDDADPDNRTMEFFGPFNVVNGTIWPCIRSVPGSLGSGSQRLERADIRLAALRGGHQCRPVRVKKPPLKAFTVIGTDGGLRDTPSDPLE